MQILLSSCRPETHWSDFITRSVKVQHAHLFWRLVTFWGFNVSLDRFSRNKLIPGDSPAETFFLFSGLGARVAMVCFGCFLWHVTTRRQSVIGSCGLLKGCLWFNCWSFWNNDESLFKKQNACNGKIRQDLSSNVTFILRDQIKIFFRYACQVLHHLEKWINAPS